MKKTIRDTALSAIENLAGLTTARIGRRHKWAVAQLPAAVIFTDNEKSERICFSPVKIQHEVELLIRLDVKPGGIDLGEDTTDELIDAIDAAVLPAIAALDGILDIVQTSIATAGDGESDADYLQTTRTYTVQYVTSA